jgi:hypothetical protein
VFLNIIVSFYHNILNTLATSDLEEETLKYGFTLYVQGFDLSAPKSFQFQNKDFI